MRSDRIGKRCQQSKKVDTVIGGNLPPADSLIPNEPAQTPKSDESDAISPKRDTQSRKYQLTINNPLDYGLSHDEIKRIYAECLTSVKYWCMADEQGSCPHTHIYAVFRSPVRFSTLKKYFPKAHIEPAYGTSQQNRDYVAKESKWADDAKHGTKVDGTFEEWGVLPSEKQFRDTDAEAVEIVERVKDGASTAEILQAFPKIIKGIRDIDYARQSILAEENRSIWRPLETTYIQGETGTGKTRYVMEKYGYSDVYRVTNYRNPFDEYLNEKVLLLDEFFGQFMIQEILNYLDGYPLALPARYTNKQAAYTKVYIVSNIDIGCQYGNVRRDKPAVWDAFIRRIHRLLVFYTGGKHKELNLGEHIKNNPGAVTLFG